jgi:multiple sugar transport system ATP-binding protein
MPSESLTFEGVSKSFDEIVALKDLDLEVAKGELMVLVGPSGSGKTTALRAAAGLEAVTRGTIRIGDRDVTRVAAAERNVSMVFQSYALFPHLPVAENIGFGLAVRKVPKDVAMDRVRRAATLVGCDDLLERRPHQLSGGERQRVALARALVRNPTVFLLDEPLSNLDAQLRVRMRAELKQLHQRVRPTMVYVTHDQVEALTLGDRVAVLNFGVMQQVGDPDEIYRRPANRFVAGFVGSPAMNFLPANIRNGQLRSGPFDLPPPPTKERLGRRHLEMGIRPEHLRVRRDRKGVPATVEVVEAAGNETFLHLRAGDHRLVARVGPDLRPAVGAVLHVEVPAGRAYVFDGESGRTLVQAT